ncbi:ATP-dependent exoDNAse (exonuclease V) beta subunit (contains helicase and exonuclease domains) [bacterium A37T11]|nr:ATP-dependent exoDNAse (exonuclease V) beta subunit (contains helicase and exonuclease domains) [bacterium A37T11]
MQTVPPLKILKASAGSGKTFSLTLQYLFLLLSGENKFREILAVTFTNKATAEMKQRIMDVLEALAKESRLTGTDKASSYRTFILQEFATWDEEMLQQKASHIYRQILHDYSRFSVSTIDGFVQRVIRSFTFELGIDASYKLEMNLRKVKNDLVTRLNQLLDERPDLLQWIIDYAQSKIDNDDHWNYRYALSELADEIFKEYFQDYDQAVSRIPGHELFQNLDQYTKETIRQFEEEFKNTLNKAAELVRSWAIDAAEFNQKSRNYLSKLHTLSPADPADVVSKTRKYIDQPQEWQNKGLTQNMAALYSQLNPLLKHLDHFYQEKGGNYYLAKAINDNLYYLRLLKEMSNLLAGWRKENSAQLISDAQILLNNIGMTETGDPTFIWEKTGQRYRHFLFDEFQDTSRKQWENFRPLLINALGSASGQRTEHLMVGDVKQSIYRWRNGDWRILLERAENEISIAFNNPIQNQLFTNETLDVNYRSHENIVAFNNLLFHYAPAWVQDRINSRILTDLGAETYEKWWQASGLHNTILRAYQDSGQEMPQQHKKQGGIVQVDFLEVENNLHRASSVKQAAMERLYTTLEEWMTSGRYRPGQIGILVRNNRDAKELVAYLLDQRPAFEIISAEALLLSNHPAIQLLINTLYAQSTRPPDDGLYKATAIYLYNRLSAGHQITADDWIYINERDPAQLAGLLPQALCEHWEAWQQLPLAELCELLIREYGLQDHAASLPYLLAFRDLIAAFTAGGERGIPAFLTYWAEEGSEKALPSGGQSDAVEVITIHKSKGLAFDVVMIPFCSWELDGRPNSNFWVDTSNTPYSILNKVPLKYKADLGKSVLYRSFYEEMLYNYMDALNTCYVANTRARQHLYITAPGKKGDNDTKSLLVSDVLLEVLTNHAAALNITFTDRLHFDQNQEAATVQKPTESVEQSWKFTHYPVSGHIQQVLIGQEELQNLDILSREKVKRQGRLLHELLARSPDESQLSTIADQLTAEGWMHAAERAEVLLIASQTYQHPTLQKFISSGSGYQQFNEKSIILPGGKTLRPDKILIGHQELIVIDFKFTSGQEAAHIQQINAYKQALQQLGHPNIRAYIYYGYEKELKAV